MHVTEISLAVVKGTRLVHPPAVDLEPGGLRDDRRFHVVAADRRQHGATRAALTQVAASWEPEERWLGLRFPDGSEVAAPVEHGAAVDATVWWDKGRVVAGRAVAGPFAAALSDYLGERVELVEAATPGRARDVGPVTLLGAASVAQLEEQMAVAALGSRRFRLNLTFDGAAAHEEDRWYGRTVAIGSARLRVTGPVPRCVVTTRDPDSGRRDHPTLKAIVSYRDPIPGPDGELVRAPFGVYADVVQPGRIAVGDRVKLAG